MNDKVRVLIVDERYLACAELKYFFSLHPDVEVLGCCDDTASAWTYVETGLVDVLLLEIYFCCESDRAGLDLAIQISQSTLPQSPHLIFTGDFERYFQECRALCPLGFLRKPYDIPEDYVSWVVDNVRLGRAKSLATTSTTMPLIGIWVNGFYKDCDPTVQICRYLKQGQIVYVEANYCATDVTTSNLHIANGLPIAGISMPFRIWGNHPNLPTLFRIHRKYVVNVCYIDRVKADPNVAGNYCVTIRGSNLELPASLECLQELHSKVSDCLERLSVGADFV